MYKENLRLIFYLSQISLFYKISYWEALPEASCLAADGILCSELSLPAMRPGLVEAGNAPVVPAGPALKVMGTGVPITPEKNRKWTFHFKYTWTSLPRGDLTIQSVPTPENGSVNPVTFCAQSPTILFYYNFPQRFWFGFCYFIVFIAFFKDSCVLGILNWVRLSLHIFVSMRFLSNKWNLKS